MRVIGLAGWSGSGKTTLLCRLLPILIERGVRVSTLKHAHHDFDVDQPGKDSWAHRAAGATEVLVASARRWALMHELRGDREPSLAELLDRMSPVDLVVVEGFKREPHPKIEIHRQATGKPPLHPHDPSIVAIASDIAFPAAGVPVLGLDDVAAIADIALNQARPVGAIPWRMAAEEGCRGPAIG
ncbi:molybdopterin-guanine dinucleotide biosynthesis protein B [Acidiphilium sp.]|uniref:molybdopterin-guanine dinucleotide biosynthesis protein B n=1 Tax=Acidiphilium sp. TaxID=527 RepID=UPI002584358C|nr:molybdopterin-guanine dinucleotide biosynthesis protein B [Acidiphilium sp.]